MTRISCGESAKTEKDFLLPYHSFVCEKSAHVFFVLLQAPRFGAWSNI